MPFATLAARNIFITDSYGETVAGCRQFGGTTFRLLFSWLKICIAQPTNFILVDDAGSSFSEMSLALVAEGRYMVAGADRQPCLVQLSTETVRVRNLSTNSTSTPPDVGSFCDRVRKRDRRCIATGTELPQFIGLQTAHIVAKAHLDYWVQADLKRHIIDRHPTQGPSQINSVQNGILLRADMHHLWDMYGLTINPWTMRLQVFVELLAQYNGAPVFIGDSEEEPSPPPELLTEHYRQAVLANIRGTGEVQILDIDPEDEGNAEAFQSGDGKIYFENRLAERLIT